VESPSLGVLKMLLPKPHLTYHVLDVVLLSVEAGLDDIQRPLPTSISMILYLHL